MWKSVTCLDMIQQRCQKFGILTIAVNVNESMTLYYRKYGQKLKERMPLEPIRFGYKFWCFNLEGGYLYNFEIYQGKGSKNEFSNQSGLGPSVVLGLKNGTLMLSLVITSTWYIPLLKHLKTKEIGCTGTIKENMWQDCPLPSKNAITKIRKGHLLDAPILQLVLNLSYKMAMGQLLWDQTLKVLSQ